MIWLQKHDRVTIDVDKPSLFLCLKKLAYGLRLLRCSFDVYLSSGKKGFHVIFHKVLPYWKILFYRLVIGDDKRRLWYDFLRLWLNEPQLFDLLFDRYRWHDRKNWKRHFKITDYATRFINQLPISATYISDATYCKNKKQKS